LYEKEDLVEFLKNQARQADNRITQSDLRTANYALAFADKTVGQIMTPKNKIKWVAGSDPIGPMVMDELHKSGQTRFPVVKEASKSANPDVIGVLYLNDLLDKLETNGRIRDIMHSGVSYINEAQTLNEAAETFLKSGQLLLVVLNNFDEVAGTISLEDVLGQVFGKKITEDSDQQNVSQETAAKVK
jgi:CBS domain containing-hemolysin-like protein